jgi:hypothetical protein
MVRIACEECGKERYEYPYRIKKYQRHFCSRLCQNRFYNRNHPEHQKKAGELGGVKTQVIIKKKYGLEFYKQQYQKNIEKNPDLHERGGIARNKKYPNHMQEMHKHWKEQDPEGRMQHLRNNGLKSIKILRENKPYWLDGVPFDSKSEMMLAKYLVENKFIDKLIEGKNCHVKMGNIEIDFLVNGTFYEYHPIIKGLYKQNANEYYMSRRKILDEAGYKNSKLILLENVKNIANVLHL